MSISDTIKCNMDSKLKILGLSDNTRQVFELVVSGLDTPLKISKQTHLSRPAIYAILEKLQQRGLVSETKGTNGSVWKKASSVTINQLLEDVKKDLSIEGESIYQYEESDVKIRIYRGQESIIKLMQHIFKEHKGQKCIGIQGVNVYEGWKELMGVELINELNKSIKKNGIINQAIVAENHFQNAISTMGTEWGKHFEGRAYRVNEIPEKYFNHKGEMFMFKDSVYLISMEEKMVIEIKHSSIQKMLLSLVEYVQDSSKLIDGNERLRELLAQKN